MTDLPDIHLEESGSKGRYFIRLPTGEEAEMTFSKVGERQIIIDHTGVPDAFRGQGAGLKLVTRAVEADVLPRIAVPTLLLYPSFLWDDEAYQLQGDPEKRTFAEILVDVVATEVIEPWGGGKWHLEVFRSTAAEPEDWNGEM